jgi:hypothetical protein
LPTLDVLEVVTAIILSNHDYDGVKNVMDTMTGRKIAHENLPDVGPLCRKALIKQFPVLGQYEKGKEVIKNFFDGPRKSMSDIDKWVATQIQKIGGHELDVNPIELDSETIKKMQTTNDMLESKKKIALNTVKRLFEGSTTN